MVLGGHGFWRCAVQLAAGWQVTVPDVFSLNPVLLSLDSTLYFSLFDLQSSLATAIHH